MPTIIPAFPLTLVNGTPNDATQVMTLLNYIQSTVNANTTSSYATIAALNALTTTVAGITGALAGISTISTANAIDATTMTNHLIVVTGAASLAEALPAANAIHNGDTIRVVSQVTSNGVVTLSPAGTDTLQFNGTTVATLKLYLNEFATLVSDGVSKWYVAENSISADTAAALRATHLYTSTTTVTIPANVFSVPYEVVGAGAAGGGSSAGNVGATGAAGGYSRGILSVTPGGTIAITITAGAVTLVSGATTVSCGAASGTTGGTASGGTVNIPGAKGNVGGALSSSATGAAGASSLLGIGGTAIQPLVNTNGNAAVGYGSGGGGSVTVSSGTNTGGAAGPAAVILEF